MRGKSSVVLWSWSLDDDLPIDGDPQSLLSDDEVARSRAFASSELRRRFVGARAGVRLLLGRHLGCDPRGLTFSLNEFGKPFLAGGKSVHFSLSHSAEKAVLAVSDTLEIGVDLERVRPIEHLDLAHRYFHPDEHAAIARPVDMDHQRHAFFMTWTLKEAIVKALGKGLSIELDSFAVSVESSPPRLLQAPEGVSRDWWLDVTATADGYCRALAAPASGDVGLIQRTL